MKKVVPVLLLCCILLGLLPVTATASDLDTWDPVDHPLRIQYLSDPVYEHGSLDFIREGLLIFRRENKSGMMDVYGKEILPPVYDSISHVGYGCFAVKKGAGLALFSYETQQTEFYGNMLKFKKLIACIRGETTTGDYLFFGTEGKALTLPKVEDSWKAYDVIPEKAVLLIRSAGYYTDPATGKEVYSGTRYRLVDWAGKELCKATGNTLEFLNDYSYSLRSGNKSEKYYLNGEPLKTAPSGYYDYLGMNDPEALYVILCTSRNNKEIYCLFDRDYKLIRELETLNNIYGSVVGLSNTEFLVKHPDGYCVIMNHLGQELAQLPGKFATFVGVTKTQNYDEKLDYFLTCDGQNSYLYNREYQQLAVLEGCVDPENKGNLIVGRIGKEEYALYDIKGQLLFTYKSKDNISVRNGVILKELKGEYAVVNRAGEPISPYHFTLSQNTTTYGLIYTTVLYEEGIFLVNAAGEILNEVGFDKNVEVYGSYGIYTQGGKDGLLRLVKTDSDAFIDVPRGIWYYDSVNACVEKGLFKGVAPGRFAPDDTMTRAMLVTVLWRLDGEQSPLKDADFTDVSAKQWYGQAVAWASENGIVNGVGKGRFDPDGTVTREQIATILHRYAVFKGIDTEEAGELSQYPDSTEVSAYAQTALAWAKGTGLINGVKTGGQVLLQPKGDATRAQVATILIRYVENLT